MFVSKKKYNLLLKEFELMSARTVLAELRLAEFHGLALKNGGIYKCIQECRQAAIAVAQPGSELADLTTERLAFIDKRLNDLLPAISEHIPDREKLMWDDMLVTHSAETAYGSVYLQMKEKCRR
ncbi:hypothetical protein [Pectobacterium versatile]|uniref:hypothetical protein n=1 Tax=Pectobacterium versatile TaxID=2488639 RepID=UPI002B23EE58|nr:hypothetical protein [Pectobacterium versatile]